MTDMVNLSDEQLISTALNMWANHVETGDINTSAKDAESAKLHYNALSLDQMKLIIRLRELGQNFLGS